MGWLADKLVERTTTRAPQGPSAVPLQQQPGFIPPLPEGLMPGQQVYQQQPNETAGDFIYDSVGNKVPNIYKPWSGNVKDGWAGDPSSRGSHCPQCGGTNFFSRKSTRGREMGLDGTTTIMTKDGRKVGPAPHCFDCGYTGGSVDLLPFGGVLTGNEGG